MVLFARVFSIGGFTGAGLSCQKMSPAPIFRPDLATREGCIKGPRELSNWLRAFCDWRRFGFLHESWTARARRAGVPKSLTTSPTGEGE